MRVIDLNTEKVYEIGLFPIPRWGHAMRIRLLEFPLVFGEKGASTWGIWSPGREMRQTRKTVSVIASTRMRLTFSSYLIRFRRSWIAHWRRSSP